MIQECEAKNRGRMMKKLIKRIEYLERDREDLWKMIKDMIEAIQLLQKK